MPAYPAASYGGIHGSRGLQGVKVDQRHVFKEPPIYTLKLNCFSLGVLAVQIITRKLPCPGSRRRQECRQNPSIYTDDISKISLSLRTGADTGFFKAWG